MPKLRRSLSSLLAGAKRSILEVGAGTGLVTAALAEVTPAGIFALESSAAMRAVLLSRLGSRPDLLGRVTVLSCDGLSVRLDEPAEAVVMVNVIYALEPDYLRRLWPVLAAALEPGGLLVFTGRDGGPPAPHPLREPQSRQVGRHTYTVLTETLGSDGEACRTRYLYRIAEGATVLSEEQLTGCSYYPAPDVLRHELAAAGFTQTGGAGDLLAWRCA